MDCWRSVFLRRGGGGEARLRLQHRMSELRNLWLTKRQAVERVGAHFETEINFLIKPA